MERLKKLQKIAETQPVLLSGNGAPNPNAYYFTGVYDENFAVFADGNNVIAYGTEKYGFADTNVPIKKMRAHFWQHVKREKIRFIGIDESNGLLWSRLLQKKVKPVPLLKKFHEMRANKDIEEKKNILQAQKITKACFNAAAPGIFGKTESHAAGLLELEARKRGSRLSAFPPIVASGQNGAKPHAVPTMRIITRADAVVVDIGVKYEQYCADFSHTIYGGKDLQIKDAVEAVKEAGIAANKKAKAGNNVKALNAAALGVIGEYGFEKYSHKATGLRIGHHVGLEVHDGPALEGILKKGFTFTIEPGIYIPRKFGVRFEDIVLL